MNTNTETASGSLFFEQLRELTRNEPRSNNPRLEDPVELVLMEYYRINPYHLPLKNRFMKWFKQFERSSRRCHEDLMYIPIYFFPLSKNYDKLHLNFILTAIVVDIDDLTQADKTYMTDFAVNCLKELNPDPTLPPIIREFIQTMIEFCSGVDDYVKDHYLMLMVDFFKGCMEEHNIDRWSFSAEEYIESRINVILMRMYAYAIWIVEDKFGRKEFDLIFNIIRDMDVWGIFMNDHLSVWKEIEDKDSGNWIIIKCWQTGAQFSVVYAEQFKQTLDQTYLVINKLNLIDLTHHTDIGKYVLHFIAGLYIWSKYSKRYGES